MRTSLEYRRKEMQSLAEGMSKWNEGHEDRSVLISFHFFLPGFFVCLFFVVV